MQATFKPGNETFQSSANVYRKQDILMSSPEKQVLHVFDVAVQSCNKKKKDKARAALVLLIDSLDFEKGKDIAKGLFRLYEYCLRLVHKDDFDSAENILKDLRQTWQMAISRNAA